MPAGASASSRTLSPPQRCRATCHLDPVEQVPHDVRVRDAQNRTTGDRAQPLVRRSHSSRSPSSVRCWSTSGTAPVSRTISSASPPVATTRGAPPISREMRRDERLDQAGVPEDDPRLHARRRVRPDRAPRAAPDRSAAAAPRAARAPRSRCAGRGRSPRRGRRRRRRSRRRSSRCRSRRRSAGRRTWRSRRPRWRPGPRRPRAGRRSGRRSPVSAPGPSTKGSTPKRRCTAAAIVPVTIGTTEAIAAPRRHGGLEAAAAEQLHQQQPQLVRGAVAVVRDVPVARAVRRPRKTPRWMLVLPTSRRRAARLDPRPLTGTPG